MTTAEVLNGRKIKLTQFEGCLLGVLVGDCLGLPYENESEHQVESSEIQHFFNRLCQNEEALKYSDDSSMTKTFAEFLIEIKFNEFDARKLAKKFTEAYLNETKGRGYGTHIPIILNALNDSKCAHPFKPSQKQFKGQGSHGNGAAMRISPLSLLTIHEPDVDNLTNLTIASSRITHGHPLGIIGAIFQAVALRQALLYGVDLTENYDGSQIPVLSEDQKRQIPSQILNSFRKEFKEITAQQFPFSYDRVVNFALKLYAHKFRTIRKLLSEGNSNLSIYTVKSSLAVKVTAADSVPTAFFCFLAAFQDIPFIKTNNQFQRTIQLAITCGGDTDTIASMAGALAGSFLGAQAIPSKLLRHCEDHPNFCHLAQKLFDKYQKLLEDKSKVSLTPEFKHRSSHKLCQIF